MNNRLFSVPAVRLAALFTAVLGIVACTGRAFAQPVPTVHGWAASYAAAGARSPVIAHTQHAAFAVQAGETVHPSVAPEAFVATFDGLVTLSAPGRYRFGADCEGGVVRMRVFGPTVPQDVTLEVDGSRPASRVSGWVTLPAGTVNVQYRFTRSGNAKAKMRAIWEMEYGTAGGQDTGFRREPIPDRFVTPPPSSLAAVEQSRLELRGRVLLGELGCTSCHATDSAAVFARTAPDLAAIGSRASAFWLRKWIADPARIKAHSGMPAVLGNDPAAADRAAEDISHYLATLVDNSGPWKPEAPAFGDAVVQRGQELYHSVGCVTCHGAYNDSGKGYDAPHPHGMLAAKWRPSALAAFLQSPHDTRPGGRMPALNLNQQEADALSVYLLKTWGGADATATLTPDPARVAAGRAAFVASGCLNCHEVADAAAAAKSGAAKILSAPPLARVRAGRGCLDPRDARTPRYDLTAQDRAALAAAIGGAASWTSAHAPGDFALRAVDALSCRACHEYGANDGGAAEPIRPLFGQLVEADLGDEGRFPPRITGVGSKLTTDWLRRVLLDAGVARPYMSTRMPQFGQRVVGHLAEALACADGVFPDTDVPAPVPTDEMVLAGKKLAGETGLYCINCHTFNGQVTGTPGPDITNFASRIRYEWWADYIHDPDRFKPGTRMQKFYRNNKGTIASILEGDSRRQSDAMWAYFNLGLFMPAPEGLTVPGGYAVNVLDKPVVLRTFMRDGGSRAIAVGYPTGVHFAFDSVQVRLVDAWRGSFLDAAGAWANRGGSNVTGQGPVIWNAPRGPALLVGERPAAWPTRGGREAGHAFNGYRLDESGAPVFLYSIADSAGGEVRVEERFRAIGGGGGAMPTIVRTFAARGLARGTSLWLHAGAGSAPHGEPSGCTIVAAGGGVWRIEASGDAAAEFSVEITPGAK
ncbi:MAG: cytochrome c [Phycisphaeraceae bacterium]|nr:cytochrome c [Phycisphaeraceae bacterium]